MNPPPRTSKVRPGAEARALFPFFTAHAESAYLDSGATAQKPAAVIRAICQFYERENANVHRGAYELAAQATIRLEEVRAKVGAFIGTEPSSIVFTFGCTDGINLAARSIEHHIGEGDVILLSYLEHHSNIVPWQLVAKRRAARLEYIDILPSGHLDFRDYEHKVRQFRPRLVACTSMSNVLGSAVPIGEITAIARSAGALTLIDAAQSVVHGGLEFDRSQADFLTFSAHKLYGPGGIGVLAVRRPTFDLMEPVRGGGGMIEDVQEQYSTWLPAPQKFEGGTPPIASVMGLGAAIDFLADFDGQAIRDHEHQLATKARAALSELPGVSLLGELAPSDGPIVSFNVEGLHPHDFATIADEEGVQVRAGHHCAKLLLRKLGVASCIRASLGLYSVEEDVDRLVSAVKRAQKIFRV